MPLVLSTCHLFFFILLLLVLLPHPLPCLPSHPLLFPFSTRTRSFSFSLRLYFSYFIYLSLLFPSSSCPLQTSRLLVFLTPSAPRYEVGRVVLESVRALCETVQRGSPRRVSRLAAFILQLETRTGAAFRNSLAVCSAMRVGPQIEVARVNSAQRELWATACPSQFASHC